MEFIEKIKTFQDNIENNHKKKKEQRRLQYQLFLQKPNRRLPHVKTLEQCRNLLIYIPLLVISINVIIMAWSWPCRWVLNVGMMWDLIMNLPGMVFLCLLIFAGLFDYAIYKRSNGTTKTIVNWGSQDYV